MSQVYERIDGTDQKNFDPKAAILLDVRLSRDYNALRWSLYRKVSYSQYLNRLTDVLAWRLLRALLRAAD